MRIERVPPVKRRLPGIVAESGCLAGAVFERRLLTGPLQQRRPARGQRRARGFTLLEVLVALTITGIALGGLFGVIAGNKRLAWRAEAELLKSTQVRSLINFAQLHDERGEVSVAFENDDLRLFTEFELEAPERRTAGSQQALRGYEVLDENGETVATGTYWVELAEQE